MKFVLVLGCLLASIGNAALAQGQGGFGGCYLSPTTREGALERGAYAYFGRILLDRSGSIVGGMDRELQPGDRLGEMRVACDSEGRLVIQFRDQERGAVLDVIELQNLFAYEGDFSELEGLDSSLVCVSGDESRCLTRVMRSIRADGYSLRFASRVSDEARFGGATLAWIAVKQIERTMSEHTSNVFILGLSDRESGETVAYTIGTNLSDVNGPLVESNR